MLKRSAGLFLAILLAVLGFPCAVMAAQPRLILDTPKGGEFYYDGQNQQVRVISRIKLLKVELSRDGGLSYNPMGTIDNTSRDPKARFVLNWKVTLPESKYCQIRVSDMAGVFSQVSQQFSIGPGAGGNGVPGETVTTADLVNSAVTAIKISDQAVQTSKLADGSVTTPKLADQAVTTQKVADLAVTSQKITSGPASNQFVLAADGLGGAAWMSPASILVTPNFGSQNITTTGAVMAGSVITTDLNVSGSVQLPPNSINSAALPSTVTLQGNTFNGASQLLMLDNAGRLPAVDGSNLLNISSSLLNGQNSAYHLNRTNHTGTQTAATISNFDTQVRTSRLDQMAAPTASVALNAQKLTGVANPTNPQDAATMAYVDSAGTTLNTSIAAKVSKAGDTMSGTLTAGGDGVKVAAQAGAGDAGTVTKLEVLKSDNSTAFKVTAAGDVTATSFVGPLTGTASNATQLNSQAASYYLDRTNHTGTQAASTISNFDTQVRTSRLDQMAAPTASVVLNAQKLTGVANPTNPQDAATMAYVDSAGTTLNTSIAAKVSKAGDTMSGTLTAGGDGVKVAAQAGAGDAGTVTKLEVLKSDNSTAFKVTAAGDVTATSFVGPLTGTASNATQLNSQAASYYLDRTNHTGTQAASTISNFDTQVRTSRLDQMAAPTASVVLNAQKLTGVANPTNPQDAATMAYVDSAGTTLNTSIAAKVSKAGDTMSGTLTAGGDGVKVAAQAGAGDAGTVTKLEVLKSDNSTAFKVTAAGDVTATSFVGPLTGTASNATQLNSQAASYYLDRTNHTGTQAASTISNFDTQVRTSRLDQMAAPTGSVALNAQSLTGVANPTNPQDAATKAYVDSAGTTLNTSISGKVSKTGDTMSGTLNVAGNGTKVSAQAGAGDAGTVTKLDVVRADTSSAFTVNVNGDTNVGGLLTLQKAAIPAVVALATSGNVDTDASLGSVFTITLTGDVNLQPPTNPTSGQRCLWRFRQPAAGGPHIVTLNTGPGGFRFGADIPGVSLSTGANKVDYMGAIWNATDSKWDVIAFVQGY